MAETDLGSLIKKLRKNLGWSQYELSRRCGFMGNAKVHALESSKQKSVTLSNASRIAFALGVPLSRLNGELPAVFATTEDPIKTSLYIELRCVLHSDWVPLAERVAYALRSAGLEAIFAPVDDNLMLKRERLIRSPAAEYPDENTRRATRKDSLHQRVGARKHRKTARMPKQSR